MYYRAGINSILMYYRAGIDSILHVLQGWYWRDCSKPCVQGQVENDDCVCEPCYSGAACDMECSLHGSCINDTCHCLTLSAGKALRQHSLPIHQPCIAICFKEDSHFCIDNHGSSFLTRFPFKISNAK